LIAPLAQVGGGSSVAGILGCGAPCVLIALCFAELSSLHDRSGGPYVYARDAFGKHVGFAVGWLGMATGVLGLAAVSVGFATALGRFVPVASVARVPVAVALIALLGFINWVGVKAGGRTSTALAVVLGYASLVDVSNVVILSGYALTCLAALVLRVRRPEAPRRYRPPLLIPVLAFSAAVALLVSARPKAAEWRFAALLLGAGFACWTATGMARRILAPRP
jgi:amino acid transporter